MKYAVAFFYLLLFTFWTQGQVQFGLALNHNCIDGQSRLVKDVGIQIESSYSFFEASDFSLELGAGLAYNQYSKIDYYSNTLLVDDPNYVSDYSVAYDHRTRNLELLIPLLGTYNWTLNNNHSIHFGLGITTRFYLNTRSRVSLNNSIITEDASIRLTDLNEWIKLQESIYIGYPFKQFEFRLQEDGHLTSSLGLNQQYYHHTDKEIRLAQISIKILYKL